MRVGLVGVGRIGGFHLETLAALDGLDLAVADADPDRARAAAARHGATAYGSADELAAAVDALVIATATGGHAPLLRLAADAGVPAFCEKPVALDVASLDDVIARVHATGILVQVGFQRRFDAGYRAARAAVTAGE